MGERQADGSGANRETVDGEAPADHRRPSPGLGPASIRQPTEVDLFEGLDQSRKRAGERFAASAYFALWGLYELDPASEPEHFKETRLTLDQRLSCSADLPRHQPESVDRPALQFVRERSSS